eukprot:CAMPEP_0114599154 /NCGR_PEP_ID=MMETSP0125-20121206/21632_1 /TAXON_ID=485358 ORGANISM="Aristerostoma sp., Strain ATCC 50986" /NCGR_SAMPLE_ID=MMETSP0125 /ASSEMBLY_ACC=CAM_ASM_000245 /LENGTH=58 /DNA_ID=CAMNT_0001805817 /DNA_START=229 /DNA_END=402 /DNA_ORIENTATION=+
MPGFDSNKERQILIIPEDFLDKNEEKKICKAEEKGDFDYKSYDEGKIDLNKFVNGEYE